jgi:hypothetical protein
MERAEALASLVSTARSSQIHRSRTPSVSRPSVSRKHRRTLRVRLNGSSVSIPVGVALIAACAGSADVPVRSIAYDTTPWGLGGFIPRQLHVAVQDDSTWQSLWRAHLQGDSIPPVDFRRETVLVFAEGGTSASSDPLPEFRGSRRVGDTLVVQVRRKENCAPGTDDIILPMALGRVPRHDGPVVFDFEGIPCDGQPTIRHRFVAG